MAGCQGVSMTLGGRNILINSSLTSIPIYYMSMYLIPKTNIARMDKIRKRFFWQGGSLKKKYHLVKWCKICKPKEKGGLGIKDLRKLNISLLAKWWWKLENENGLWQDLVKQKYIKNKCLSQVKHRQNDSPVWSDLLKVRDVYLQGRLVIIGLW